MFRTVLTTTVLVGALLVSTAGAGAQPKGHPGGETASSVGASSGDDQTMCAFLKFESSAASEAAQQNYAAGDRKRGRHFEQVADDDYEEAHDLGCGWAA
jgi:hypothetical protein